MGSRDENWLHFPQARVWVYHMKSQHTHIHTRINTWRNEPQLQPVSFDWKYVSVTNPVICDNERGKVGFLHTFTHTHTHNTVSEGVACLSYVTAQHCVPGYQLTIRRWAKEGVAPPVNLLSRLALYPPLAFCPAGALLHKSGSACETGSDRQKKKRKTGIRRIPRRWKDDKHFYSGCLKRATSMRITCRLQPMAAPQVVCMSSLSAPPPPPLLPDTLPRLERFHICRKKVVEQRREVLLTQ